MFVNQIVQGTTSQLAARRPSGRRLTALSVVAALLSFANPGYASGITQLEYLQWLVQLSGESAAFSANASAGDYTTWARSKGMTPKQGWKLNSTLSREALGETLVQFLRVAPQKQEDAFRALARIGIELPSDTQVSRKGLASLVDNVQSLPSAFKRPKSPSKPDRDRDTDRDKDKDNRPPPPPKPKDRDIDRDRDNDRG